MKEKGHEVHLATDARGLAYLPQLEEMPVHKLARQRYLAVKYGSPMAHIENYLRFCSGGSSRAEAQTFNRCRLWRLPVIAPALAAQVLGRQVLIHEQNAVLGAANRVLCGLGAHLATSFGGTRGYQKLQKQEPAKSAIRAQ